MTEPSDEAQASLRSSIMQDPFVMDLIQKMGAVVIEGSIKAYDGPDVDPLPEVRHRAAEVKVSEQIVQFDQTAPAQVQPTQPAIKSPVLSGKPNFSSKPISKHTAKTPVNPVQPAMADLFSEPAPVESADNFQSSSDDTKPITPKVRKVFNF